MKFNPLAVLQGWLEFSLFSAGNDQIGPGSIIKSRYVSPWEIPDLETRISSAQQITYSTRDTFFKQGRAVTTVLVPKTRELTATSPQVVSYQIPEDAVADQCAPSKSLLVADMTDVRAIKDLLDAGYIVNTPDYEGERNAFTAGIQSGRATLDSIRAVLQSLPAEEASVILWGYSGGSIATGWALELQPEYAPELEDTIIGGVVGGYSVDPSSIINVLNGTLNAGLLPASLIGLSNEYPEVEKLLQSQLVDEHLDEFYYPNTHCIEDVTRYFAYKDVFRYFKDGHKILDNRILTQVSDNITLGKYTPRIPMFIYHGIEDELIDYRSVDAVVQKYCSQGAKVDYVQNLHGDHMETEFYGVDYALNWIQHAFSGSLSSQCTFKQVNFNSRSSSNLITYIRNLYRAIII